MNSDKKKIIKKYINSNHKIYQIVPGVFVESTKYDILELYAFCKNDKIYRKRYQPVQINYEDFIVDNSDISSIKFNTIIEEKYFIDKNTAMSAYQRYHSLRLLDFINRNSVYGISGVSINGISE